MPNFDGTGPNGQGSMTGRGQGPCARRGAGMGRGGFARGMGRCFAGFFGRGQAYSNEPYALEDEEKDLKARLKEIEEMKKEK
jgi:hypothetical protein